MMLRTWIPAAFLLAAPTVNDSAVGENWYLGAVWITHDRLEFKPLAGNGSVRDVWDRQLFSGHDFPLFGDEPPGSPSLLGHLRFDCAHNQMQVVEAQDLDSAGRVTRTHNNAPAPRNVSTYDPAWQRVFDSVCQGTPTHWPRPPREVSRATPSVVLHGLAQDESTQRRWAIAQVEAEPGAFTPDVLLRFANTLAVSDRREDALHWWLFGLLRAYTDQYALHPGLDGASEAERMLLENYKSNEGASLAQQFKILTPDQRAALIASAAADDENIPRYYPIDWPSWGAAQYINWTAPRNAPGTDFVARARLNSARDDARRQIAHDF